MSQEPTAPGGAHGVPAPAKQEIYDERDRLVILTPCYGGLVTTFFRDSLHTVQTTAPCAMFRCADGSVQRLPLVAMAINHPGDSHIDRARNKILHDFEQTHYRHALFCDGDQPFEPEDIAITWFRLMTGVRVLGGTVALKTIKTTFACNTLGNTRQLDPVTRLLPGRDTGTGWLAFKRDVLDQIRTEWPKYVRARIADYIPDPDRINDVLRALAECGYSADIHYKANANTHTPGEMIPAYFASGVTFRDGIGDWLSEDWMFCHRCIQLGIEIKIDPMIRIKHVGPLCFPPAPDDLIAAALQVTDGQRPPFDARLAAEAHAALQKLHYSITDDSISILHPTRRSEQALRIRDLWLSRASNPKGIEYIFGVDHADQATASSLSTFTFQLSPPGSPAGAVAAINAAARAAKGRVLVMAADDCEPPQDWDVQIREALAGQLHLPRLLWTSDGYTTQPVITHPIMTRALYEKNGNEFFSSAYPHLFCDTELTHRAMQAGEVIDARHIVLKHQHPMFTGAKPDQLHEQRNSQEAWRIGSEIFARRNPGAKHPHAS